MNFPLRQIWQTRFSPKANFVALSYGRELILVDVDDLKKIVRPFKKRSRWNITQIRFSPNEQLLAAASDDESILLADLKKSSTRFLRGHDNNVLSIAFDPSGKYLFSGDSSGLIRRWNISNTNDSNFSSSILFDTKVRIDAIATSTDGNHLLAISSNGKAYNIQPKSLEDDPTLVETVRHAVGRPPNDIELERYPLLNN